ncbi:MAG: MBL fold metallo-hydrolase [Candidatus Rokuibacteriota bacterium]|nr:MAG: MBL fold metallo-hydrolase [Candidatus Rokubacteria bacterium]
MRKALWLLTFGLLVSLPASAQTPEVTLTRIDCGTDAQPRDVGRFSDIFAHQTLQLQFTFSCYLIKHGDEYMVWDTGFMPGSNPNAPKTSFVDYLAQLKITPDQIKYVGISHYHGDHTGQLPAFPKAMLLIGQGDWDAVNAPKPAQGVNAAAFTHWTKGGSKYEALALDKDVFGDGSVVILRTPGHTPGHSSLLVRLKERGPVLLSGDLMHFQENYETNGVPSFNTDRAQTIASLDRFKQIAAALKATVIIQHDMRDIGKLPAFTAGAR